MSFIEERWDLQTVNGSLCVQRKSPIGILISNVIRNGTNNNKIGATIACHLAQRHLFTHSIIVCSVSCAFSFME